MQVSVEINDLECRMTVGVPRMRVDEEVQKRLVDLARKSRINGFRPGKVPVRVIQQRYGEQVRQEVLGELTQESFQNAVMQEQLRPAGMPSIEFDEEDNNAEHISFTAAFEIYPELAEIQLAGISVEKVTAEVAETDIDAMISKLREQRKGWEIVAREAHEGDALSINFEGFLEGEEASFNGGSAENYFLELGGGRLIEGFETGLIGCQANEQRTLNLVFPENYQNDELAGKAVRFEITVHSVQEAKLPEVDADFIKSFGVEAGEQEAFRADIRDNLERELTDTLRGRLKQQVLDKLLEHNDIKVPKALVEMDAKQLKENVEAEFTNKGLDLAYLNLQTELFIERASKRVKLGILIAEIIKQNSLHPPAEKIRNMVENVAATYEEPETVIAWFYSDPEHLKEIEASVLEDEVVNWVLERVTVTETARSFAEVIHPDVDADNNTEVNADA